MSLLWHEPKVIEKQTVAKPHQKWIEINYRGENISKWHIWAVKKSSLLHFKTGFRSKFKPTNEWMLLEKKKNKLKIFDRTKVWVTFVVVFSSIFLLCLKNKIIWKLQSDRSYSIVGWKMRKENMLYIVPPYSIIARNVWLDYTIST